MLTVKKNILKKSDMLKEIIQSTRIIDVFNLNI